MVLEFGYDVSFERSIFSKSISNRFETGPIKEKSTNSNFFPHFLEFHMFFLEFQISPLFFAISYVLEQTRLLLYLVMSYILGDVVIG